MVVSYNQRKGVPNVESELKLGTFSCTGSAISEIFIPHAVLTIVRDMEVQAAETEDSASNSPRA